MPTTTETISTAHGPSKTVIVTPEGKGPWPIVLYFFDAAGHRDANPRMAERIAKAGYLVAIPDLFYRAGGELWDILPPGTPHDAHALPKLWADEKVKGEFMKRFYGPALDYDNLKELIGANLDYLEKRDDTTNKVGATGYCMGGNAAFRVATIFGDRIAAIAAFHPGGLVTPGDSPHQRAASIKARVYIGAAKDDGSLPEEAKKTLAESLKAANVSFEIENYDAHHGFAVPDHDAFDAPAAEKHYAALEKLFGATLR